MMSRERKKIDSLFEQLMNSKSIRFPSAGRQLDAPTDKGVYVIFGKKGVALHVGRTPRAKYGIQQRLRAHLSGNSSFVRIYLGGNVSQLRNGHRYKYIIVEDARHRALLEAHAVGQLLPKHIGVG